MTVAVEVGPVAVRGAKPVAREWVSVALECIDDRLALVDEQPVEVTQLWYDVLKVAAGDCPGALTVVVPTWWPSSRLELLAEAGRRITAEVAVFRRSALLCGVTRATVVEFGEEFIAVVEPGCDAIVFARDDHTAIDHLHTASSVLLDVPVDVTAPAPEITARARASALPIVFSDRRAVQEAAECASPAVITQDEATATDVGRRPLRVSAAITAVIAGLIATVAGAVWVLVTSAEPAAATAVLAEGRAVVRVPARWSVERITAGPGSARVRIAAPAGLPALHVTQSTSASEMTTDQVAESLRRALESEPAGVFVDFDPRAQVGGRFAVTYREQRADSETRWAVVVDGTLRIAIGCQSAIGRQHELADVCVAAVGSARAVR